MFGFGKRPASAATPRGEKKDRVFASSDAKGGAEVDASKTAVLFIEYQNEFASDGGKLHGAVKGVMESNGMLEKSAAVANDARSFGAKVFHAPISFAEDASDNPNKALGILAGCANDKLFTAGTWNADFCEAMKPKEGDVLIKGKKGLDAFPGTDLESQLVAHGVETLALAGFLTNCCVESTMRSAYEKGFNVITLTDCTAATSAEGQAAATGGTYGMFSSPMTAADFTERLKPAAQPSIRETAIAFFEKCDGGKGWEACKEYAAAECSFRGQSGPIAEMTQAEQYVEWMKAMAVAMPDCENKDVSVCVDEASQNVSIFAVFHGTHTVTPEGAPLPPPSNKKCVSDFVYKLHFNADGKIDSMVKVWNDAFATKQLGWTE